jgi:gamma-glutamyltranspeptidase
MIDFGMSPQNAIDAPRIDCSSLTTDVPPELDPDVIARLVEKGHNIRILGDGFTQTGFAKFASPAVVAKKEGLYTGGVDTFHSAHAAGI